MKKLDSHQHFWKFDPIRDQWINDEMEVIRRDFLPSDLKPILDANGIDGCIAVQADQSEHETEFLLNLAAENDFIKGVVGWTDLCAENIDERLDYYSQFPLLKGFRHILQAEPVDFILKPEFKRGLNALKSYGYTYDILVFPEHLPNILKLISDQAFVIDHLAKPDIKNGVFSPWGKNLKDIASFQNVCCKLSGMVTEANLKNWKKEDIYPYMDKVLELFGPERLMFGSDWPVCKLAAEYSMVCELVDEYISKLTHSEQELIWGKNALTFYKLD
jgi:L-fuconolactonase